MMENGTKLFIFFDDDVKEFLCLKNSSEDFSSLSQPDHGLTFGVCQMQRNKCYKDD